MGAIRVGAGVDVFVGLTVLVGAVVAVKSAGVALTVFGDAEMTPTGMIKRWPDMITEEGRPLRAMIALASVPYFNPMDVSDSPG